MNHPTRPALFTKAISGSLLIAALAACGGGDSPALALSDAGAAKEQATSQALKVSSAGTVNTAYGPLRGKVNANSYSFLGIPYAAPPVGALRWAAPAAPAKWTSERSATAFAPHCAQPASPFGSASTSEDCLYLNVYAPKGYGSHPVMVWIHGGAFAYGESDAYDPAALVAQGVVVVTINYRLGALGFMAHPALSAEQGGKSGNYGLMDQQAALRWVRDNIATFGGNPRSVTIAGESAGGFSVHSHVASAGSKGLFHKAIAMSGAYPFSAPQDTLAQAEAKGGIVAAATAAAISQAVGATVPACTTAACLRGLPANALFAGAQAAYPNGPVPAVDGVVLTQDVKATISAGTHNKVPMIEGTTRDEWRLFAALDEYMVAVTTQQPITALLKNDDDHIAKVTTLLGGAANPNAAATAKLMIGLYYPTASFANTAEAYGALGTDMVFACNGRVAALELQQHKNVYAYEFRDRTAPATLPHRADFNMGAHHTAELQYLFNVTPAPGMTRDALNTEQKVLAAAMVKYWANFVKTGNPNSFGMPKWTNFTLANDAYLGLDVKSTGGIAPLAINFKVNHNCAAWNGFAEYAPTMP